MLEVHGRNAGENIAKLISHEIYTYIYSLIVLYRRIQDLGRYAYFIPKIGVRQSELCSRDLAIGFLKRNFWCVPTWVVTFKHLNNKQKFNNCLQYIHNHSISRSIPLSNGDSLLTKGVDFNQDPTSEP